MSNFAKLLTETGEIGYVREVVQGLAWVEGLPEVRLSERVEFESGQSGQVISLKDDLVEVLVISSQPVQTQTRVVRTGGPLQICLNQEILGQTMGALGIDLPGGECRVIDTIPAGISQRRKITRPLQTGISLVDLLIPLGMGQRELILGDRKTGKTVFLFETILNQASLGSVCVYVAIGKRKSEITRAQEYFVKSKINHNIITVATTSHDSVGEIFTAPYTAMTIAEYFRDQGRDVLVVMDDLSTHAKFYREMSLLGRRFPGRDSYPGDIFNVHSRILERGGNFSVKGKEVSITCLPVAETVQGDITGYIPTNLMSMTDGHVYYDSDLFFKGRRPAINPFLSVTRVGYQTQNKLQKDVRQHLLNLLTSYEKIVGFQRFGAELGENSRSILALGEKVLTFFDQPMTLIVPNGVQLVLLAKLWQGAWDGKNLGEKVANLRPIADATVEACESFNQLLQKSCDL